MTTGRPATTDVLATYNVPFALLYSLIILAVAGICAVVTFTGEPIGAYLERKPGMALYLVVIVVGSVIEITRCIIIFYNIILNRGAGLFVKNGKIIFISKYFTSIPIDQIMRVIPRKKKTVYVILSSGKTKRIYTSFLKPSDSHIIAKKIESVIPAAVRPEDHAI